MKCVATGLRDGVDDAARGETIFRGVVAGENGEFLNSIHTEVLAEHAARTGVRIIVHDYAVKTVAVLRRTASADAQLIAESAASATSYVGDVQVSSGFNDTRLQLSQRCPVASIQGQFADSVL